MPVFAFLFAIFLSGHKRQQSHLARALNRMRQCALVLCAQPRAFARLNLFRNRGKTLQNRGIFPINVIASAKITLGFHTT
ncbi:MAG: hypothetical protein AUJ43_02275 [Parcubacteria group bacterium CG1_02_44_31]|nr:MAG: hypothetical protein AUJ43_02275 [Parcubacteria group bacterium CG1_02_44_31]